MTPAADVTLLDIFAARRRLAPHVRSTPLVHSPWLSSIADGSVHLKLESLQLTNAFKFRGAMNALLRLTEQHTGTEAIPLVVTASAGNHGRAMALAAERLGVRVVVFTPKTAPETKKLAIRRHGAELRDDAPDYDAAERDARQFAATERVLYISPYNHPDVIAGAGTIGLEIVEALPAVDTVIVPVGGGGLIGGIGVTLKGAAPHVSVIGVEAEASRAFSTSLAQGFITAVEVGESIADGLTGNLEPSSITFGIVRDVVHSMVSVSEVDLTRAIRGLAAEEHLIAEGAGAAAAAAVLANHGVTAGQHAVVVVSGANIDVQTLAKVIAD